MTTDKTSQIVLAGDCREVMATMAENSVDAIVCDPPYELNFMGKEWDASGVAYDVRTWTEALRVAKPGAYLLAFGGARTHHRVACAIEDAGWELRDTIMWIYGSGFPKSVDIAKTIRKMASRTAHDHEGNPIWCENCGEAHGVVDMTHAIYCVDCAATTWDGWGSALKPAHEPIVVARKPFTGTLGKNVLAHGTGGLNINQCRVPGEVNGPGTTPTSSVNGTRRAMAGDMDRVPYDGSLGRWPANVIHDGSDEVISAFPYAPGQMVNARLEGDCKTRGIYGAMRYGRSGEASAESENEGSVGFKMRPGARRLDSGSAARFFYAAKASTKDRESGLVQPTDGSRSNSHPTVKPTELMRYLCRLVTPQGGMILDPFCGSGSTGRGAALEGFGFVGIELCDGKDGRPDYISIARARIADAVRQASAVTQPDIFKESA